MQRPTAIKVIPEENYFLRIEFDSGEIKQFDVKPYIKGIWFGQLKDVSYFRKAMTDGYTLCWPDGQDLCPDEIYKLGVSI